MYSRRKGKNSRTELNVNLMAQPKQQNHEINSENYNFVNHQMYIAKVD